MVIEVGIDEIGKGTFSDTIFTSGLCGCSCLAVWHKDKVSLIHISPISQIEHEILKLLNAGYNQLVLITTIDFSPFIDYIVARYKPVVKFYKQGIDLFDYFSTKEEYIQAAANKSVEYQRFISDIQKVPVNIVSIENGFLQIKGLKIAG